MARIWNKHKQTNTPLKRKVFVAMSGGVDSSVAAALLKERGYQVIGVHMKCYNVDGCAEQDAEDARRAAEILGIPFYVFDFEQAYKDKVVQYMIDGYRQGITPNPDVMCNKEIKFGLFYQKALEMGADYVATGHYVRLRRKFPISNFQFPNKISKSLKIRKNENSLKIENYELKIAKDLNKDQSYFLWTLKQEQLAHCLFPVGDYQKPEVRKLAKKFGLINAEKKDSQGICFLGRVRLDDFLVKYIKPKVGQVKLAQPDGSYQVIGEHQGAHLYTIGQRHMGVKFQISNFKFQKNKGGDQKPLYVAEKDIKTNTITVAEGDNNPALYKKEIEITNVNFINSETIPLIRANRGIGVLARVRYRQPLEKATLQLINPSTLQLIFNKPQKFVAPGQSAVFYSKIGVMLGGGVIK